MAVIQHPLGCAIVLTPGAPGVPIVYNVSTEEGGGVGASVTTVVTFTGDELTVPEVFMPFAIIVYV